jgi:hypothetical protein
VVAKRIKPYPGHLRKRSWGYSYEREGRKYKLVGEVSHDEVVTVYKFEVEAATGEKETFDISLVKPRLAFSRSIREPCASADLRYAFWQIQEREIEKGLGRW